MARFLICDRCIASVYRTFGVTRLRCGRRGWTRTSVACEENSGPTPANTSKRSSASDTASGQDQGLRARCAARPLATPRPKTRNGGGNRPIRKIRHTDSSPGSAPRAIGALASFPMRSFEIRHPYVLEEPEPARRFASLECAVHSAVQARSTIIDERNGMRWTKSGACMRNSKDGTKVS